MDISTILLQEAFVLLSEVVKSAFTGKHTKQHKLRIKGRYFFIFIVLISIVIRCKLVHNGEKSKEDRRQLAVAVYRLRQSFGRRRKLRHSKSVFEGSGS